MLPSGTVITPDLKDAWLAERASTVGASEAFDAVHYPLDLWLKKTGRIPPFEATARMRAGLLLEPVLAQAYRETTGQFLVAQQVFVRDPDEPGLTATLDGIAEDETIVEFKCVGQWAAGDFGEPGTDHVPDRYAYQVQHQLLVTGAGRAHLLAFFGGDLEFRLYTIERSATFCTHLRRLELDFLRHLRDDVPPDGGAVTDPRLVEALYPGAEGYALLGPADAVAATKYQMLGETIRELEKERDAAKAQILAALAGAAEGELPDGRTVRRSKVTTQDRTVKGSTFFRLSIKEPRR